MATLKEDVYKRQVNRFTVLFCFAQVKSSIWAENIL